MNPIPLCDMPGNGESLGEVMPEKTLEALKGSIAKWEAIVAGTAVDLGHVNCPLCQLFFGYRKTSCVGCPVRDRTEQQDCDGTPYRHFFPPRDALVRKGGRAVGYDWTKSKAAKNVAQAELDFLKSLLPESNS